MPLQINNRSGEGPKNTRPSPPSQAHVPNHQPSDASGYPYDALPQYQPVGPSGGYHQPPHAHFRMSSHYSAQLPPPPSHPDYWYSRGFGGDSSWKFAASPLVKKAQSNGKDGELASNSGVQQTGKSQEQSESSPDISPLHIPKNYHSSAQKGCRNMPACPPHIYDQGPHPPSYNMPPPHDPSFSTHYRPGQWQYPPHPYANYPPPPSCYEVSPYPPYRMPPCANKPHMQSSPVVPGHKQYGGTGNAKKRPFPLYNTVPVGVPPRQPSLARTRRKRKMYSDFVGVTYNKSHAKYQACITHFRKQHYLGRYKLAVDAALAYDEAAILLKGANWKFNFLTREAYDQARIEEMQHIGRIGDKVTDIDDSNAALILAQKMAKVAQEKAVNPTDMASSNESKKSGKACYGSSKEKGGSVVRLGGGMVRFKYPLDDPLLNDTSINKSGEKKTPFVSLHTTGIVEEMSKVTPCQLELEVLPSTSSELDSKQQSSQTTANKDSIRDKAVTFAEKTPLPDSPDPTRHAQGVQLNSTPESVIKPKVLQYQGYESKQSAPESTSSRPNAARKKSLPGSESKLTASAPDTKSAASKLSNQNDTLVMKNGTFVAASALMTLHGSEQG